YRQRKLREAGEAERSDQNGAPVGRHDAADEDRRKRPPDDARPPPRRTEDDARLADPARQRVGRRRGTLELSHRRLQSLDAPIARQVRPELRSFRSKNPQYRHWERVT